MKTRLTRHESNAFRLRNPPARAIKAATAAFKASHKEAFERWADYRAHKRVIHEAFAKRLFGAEALDLTVKASLASLKGSLDGRMTFRDQPFAGPPVFHVGPGLNILGPPYDFGLNVGLGSNAPAVMIDIGRGSFAVNATAVNGKNTYGSAGVSLFIAPSDPTRTLSIRPYFEWQYGWSCESHGTPTAHSTGGISAAVSGRIGTTTKGYPGKHQHLWSGSSDLWDDGGGSDSEIFRNPDSELVVSGQEYHIVSYVCQTSGDSGGSAIGWSASYQHIHCRVPFLVVEQF